MVKDILYSQWPIRCGALNGLDITICPTDDQTQVHELWALKRISQTVMIWAQSERLFNQRGGTFRMANGRTYHSVNGIRIE